MPPRHSKSDTVSAYIEWRLAKGLTNVIYSSYTASLSNKRSRQIRNEIRNGRAFKAVSKELLTGDASAVQFWELSNGNSFVSAGVGGSVTGLGGNLLILDDPLKGRIEAESSVIRQNVMDWFTSDFITRLTPKGNLILIQTRWHNEDPSGVILKQIEKDKNFLGFTWKHINLPALDENNNALWESRYPAEKLLKLKQANEYDFASLYQQQPVPKGGTVFQDSYFYDEEPTDGYSEAIATDFAYTAKSYADYSVILVGKFYNGKLYITNMIRLQVRYEDFIGYLQTEQARTKAHIYTRIGGIEKVVIEDAQKLVNITSEQTKGDKFTNAQPCAAQWNQGNILLPKNAVWLSEFLNEVLSFTGINDRNDDIVDTLVTLSRRFFGKTNIYNDSWLQDEEELDITQITYSTAKQTIEETPVNNGYNSAWLDEE